MFSLASLLQQVVAPMSEAFSSRYAESKAATEGKIEGGYSEEGWAWRARRDVASVLPAQLGMPQTITSNWLPPTCYPGLVETGEFATGAALGAAEEAPFAASVRVPVWLPAVGDHRTCCPGVGGCCRCCCCRRRPSVKCGCPSTLQQATGGRSNPGCIRRAFPSLMHFLPSRLRSYPHLLATADGGVCPGGGPQRGAGGWLRRRADH